MANDVIWDEKIHEYEVLIIFDESLNQGNIDSILVKYFDLIKADPSKKGEVKNEDHWGKRKFAYPIDHKDQGFYEYFEFKSTPATKNEVERLLKLEDQVIRIKILRIDPKKTRV